MDRDRVGVFRTDIAPRIKRCESDTNWALMYRIFRIVISLLINLCLLFSAAVVQGQEPERGSKELKCFDEEHLPPTMAGGLQVMVTESATNTVNPHPDKKGCSDALTPGDFERRERLPNEIAQINPDIRTWTSILWEGWWEAVCSVEPFDEKDVLVTVHYFGFGSGTWFLRERSGRIVDEMGEDLLRHEQGHVDIVELGRRRWQNAIDEMFGGE